MTQRKLIPRQAEANLEYQQENKKLQKREKSKKWEKEKEQQYINIPKTSQELRMLSSYTNCQVTKIVKKWSSQLSEM